MSANRNLYLLNAFSTLMSMCFVIAVMVPFFRDELGLTFRDFLLSESVFAATLVLLEVPSGWISDVWRRKYTLAAGAFFEFIGFGIMMFSDSLLDVMVSQAVIGVGLSLISGTNSAMLYDSLLSMGREGEFRRREGLRNGLGFYSIACASMVSGFMYAHHHMLPLAAGLVAIALAFVAALLMHEPERHRRRPEKHPLADMLETARYALHGHAEVGMIILFAAILFCATKLIMWSQQPYYMAMKLPEQMFGVMMAAGFLLAGFSSQLGHLLDGRLSGARALVLVCVAAALVCLGSAVVLGWNGVVLMMIGGSCLYGIGAPRVGEAINSRVSSDRRATILSTQQLLVSLFFIPVSAVIGWVSEKHGIQMALVAIAVWLALAGACLLAVVRRRNGRAGAAAPA